jgi:ethanolamine permease
MFAAVPFAIWFFLAIEGAAMAAEEAEDPRKDDPEGLYRRHPDAGRARDRRDGGRGGVGDWRQYSNINDPLPQAMKIVVGADSGWLHMLVWIGCSA